MVGCLWGTIVESTAGYNCLCFNYMSGLVMRVQLVCIWVSLCLSFLIVNLLSNRQMDRLTGRQAGRQAGNQAVYSYKFIICVILYE